jgi:hypothetical protein
VLRGLPLFLLDFFAAIALVPWCHENSDYSTRRI